MKKVLLTFVMFSLALLGFSQNEKSYILAWCSSKDLKEVKLGCLSEPLMIVSVENGDLRLAGYKIAFVNENDETMVLTSLNGKLIPNLTEKAKLFRPVSVHIFDVIMSDKENTILLQEHYRLPFKF
jgi:hypothetical protein